MPNAPRFLQLHVVLLLLGILLLGQLGAVYHQAEHGPDQTDEICLVCQAADRLQHGLATASLANALPAAHEPGVSTSPVHIPFSIRSPSARSPPPSSAS